MTYGAYRENHQRAIQGDRSAVAACDGSTCTATARAPSSVSSSTSLMSNVASKYFAHVERS